MGQLTDLHGHVVRYGLCDGSADLVGCLTVYTGERETGPIRSARFLAIEVKQPGKRPTAEQSAWLGLVRSVGGIAGVASSVDDARELVDRARRWQE